MTETVICVNSIQLKPNHTPKELDEAVAKALNKAVRGMKAAPADVLYQVTKRSLDARRKPHIYYIYSVAVKEVKGYCFEQLVKSLQKVAQNSRTNRTKHPVKGPIVRIEERAQYSFSDCAGLPAGCVWKTEAVPRMQREERPVIIGFGPAGMFAALMLSRAGLRPIVYERGACVEERRAAVNAFWQNGMLNPESNVQFGEGGAGTFSDGKLNTQIKDFAGRIKVVLQTFVKYGADREILFVNKPHIGTDVLTGIVTNIRNEIIKNGGEVYFNRKLTDLTIADNQIRGIQIKNTATQTVEEIPCRCLCLCIGHSARDTFSMLHDRQIKMEPKAFAVGLRLEHPQALVNENAYAGTDYVLPPADYKVSYQTATGRGVYSFCMCPGGYVVNASSEQGFLAVNGMSYSGRSSGNANSAIIATVTPNDFGTGIFDGMNFQRELERKAYEAGSGKIPVQLLGDFKADRLSQGFGSVIPCMKGEFVFARLNRILPDFITSALIEGIDGIAGTFPGFDMDDAVFSGVETRTSSPVRIIRGPNLEADIAGLFPCGEGAGYAGGIMSAAVDGMKAAERIAACFYDL